MRSPIALILLMMMLLAACSREVTTAAPVSAAALPADVRDLAKTPSPAAPEAKAALAPRTAIPEMLPTSIAATGELISPMRSQLAAKQSGRVAAVYVREGARVRAGQPLAGFETDYLRLDLRRAEAELSRATAMENDAGRDLERKRELVVSDSVTRAVFDRSQTAYDSAVAGRQAASAVVATIRQRIDDATLRAPFDGAIESRSVDVGEHIGDGQPTFVIVQTSPLRLRFHLPEQYLGLVHVGQRVKATTDAYGTASFAGRIAMIGGVIDPATRTLIAEADVDNSDGRLRPGMFARVSIAQ
ncbi:MAG TPA: efflux RND transporter periplasmic adaptor subunit [Thermoanaerobaculia bacterium]|nr:efflux RND transporter periplasmic adaptor subunit [Thermoanaerobaculia bacterium]